MKKFKHLTPGRKAILLGVIGTLIAIIVWIFPVLSLLFGVVRDALHPNPAKQATETIIHELALGHTTKICDTGSSGQGLRGIDNPDAWYTIFLSVSASPGLEAAVKSAAYSQGYVLASDQQAIDPTTNTNNLTDTFNPHSSYLIAKRGANTLNAVITRDGQVSSDCATNFTKLTPSPGKAILHLDFTINRHLP